MVAGKKSHIFPALVISLGAILLPISGCKIVHDDQRTSSASSEAADAGFDATKYVDEVWDKKLTPYFDTKAIDLNTLIAALKQDVDAAGKKYGHRADAEGSPWSFPVKGRAKITAVNTESRAGTVTLEMASDSGPQALTLQIGPVVKGSAIRDSLPFFTFGSVTNQIEFAQVGRAFSDRALVQIKDAVTKLQSGTTIEFVGAISINGPTEAFLVTPISIKPEGAGQ